jgi:hypothetical protein
MKLSSEAVEQTLNQFEAEPLPDNHPAVAQLIRSSATTRIFWTAPVYISSS